MAKNSKPFRKWKRRAMRALDAQGPTTPAFVGLDLTPGGVPEAIPDDENEDLQLSRILPSIRHAGRKRGY